MRSHSLCLVLASFLLFAPRADARREEIPVLPSLSAQDRAATVSLVPPPSSRVVLKAGWASEGLWLSLTTTQGAAERTQLGLGFPTLAAGAAGKTWLLAPSRADAGMPDDPRVRRTMEGDSATLWIPRDALPPFPARGPLDVDACLSFAPPDGPTTHHCAALRLPSVVRRGAPVAPKAVSGWQTQGNAWLGTNTRGDPLWVKAPTALSPSSLTRLVTSEPVSPETFGLFIPKNMTAPGRKRPMLPVVSGKDPFVGGRCDPDRELRLSLWVVEGAVALEVLDWPVATCPLGRASSVVLEDDGGLTIGYSGGTTATFTWTGDRFERTELGMR
jgi:hypothetical protein